MPGKQRYRSVNRFASETAATTPEDRAPRREKNPAIWRFAAARVAAGIFFYRTKRN